MIRRLPVSTDKRFRKNHGQGDHGTPERWHHSGYELELTDRAGILAFRATEEHVLDVLKLKHCLSEIQVDAAFKLKADYHAAAIAAHVTGSYSGMTRLQGFQSFEHERNEAEEAAYRRWRAAVAELGLGLGKAVIATVCYDETPNDRDLAALQKGLEKLAAWYKMKRS